MNKKLHSSFLKEEMSSTRLQSTHLTMRMFSSSHFFREKDYEKAPSCVPFFSTLLPSNYGRKEENMFTMLSHSLSRSLCKLTAHHKSISAWRKSISRLPLLPQQKTYLILKKKEYKKNPPELL